MFCVTQHNNQMILSTIITYSDSIALFSLFNACTLWKRRLKDGALLLRYSLHFFSAPLLKHRHWMFLRVHNKRLLVAPQGSPRLGAKSYFDMNKTPASVPPLFSGCRSLLVVALWPKRFALRCTCLLIFHVVVWQETV